MAEPDDAAEAAARLEQALERIAVLAEQALAEQALAEQHGPAEGGAAEAAPQIDTAAMARRLDALIAKLRAVLDSSSS